MHRNVLDFCSTAASQPRLDQALQMISDFVLDVIGRQSSVGRVFSSRDLDLLCLELGRRSGVPLQEPSAREDHIAYLVTALAGTGGHTRVLRDLIRAEPAKRRTVLISNVMGASGDLNDIKALFSGLDVTIEVAPSVDLAQTLRWEQERLASLRPRKTYLLLHHFDPVSVAAAQPELVGKLVFIHNADHSLALGVHLPHALHVDLHAKGYYNCREREGVARNVVWPLTADDRGHRVDRPFLRRGHLTTCCSGGFEKFESHHYTEKVPYLYSYAELVPLMLQASKGTHIHIGTLSEAMLAKIREGMTRLGIAAQRFIYIPRVPNLWDAFLEQEVDLYIGSFPLGGGRTTVEAMGAGLPLVVHINYRSVFFTDVNEVYDGVMQWRRPQELTSLLASVDAHRLAQDSKKARQFYEANHTPAVLAEAVLSAELGRLSPTPRRPEHHPDMLQAYLDEHLDSAPAITVLLRKRVGRLLSKTAFGRYVKRILVRIILSGGALRKGAVGSRRPI